MLDWIKNNLLELLKWIVIGIIDNSYWICLFICLASLFLYIGGVKKAGKYVPASFVIYFVLQSLKGAIK